ncbi:uncharacterized protein PFL1_03599 [Pseudozyma flocculosa PF-1]|uniref:Uncharacterized protein n=2 Tax=Pseudozyma flocculosa TaxID=84751 RepID=A0A5C3F4L3_9BASI|nr:uncharacterized protein PFL1_03599 [Pseudozyma flocculosa PF-1]EPQ28796.1 hypothetical protein PFL1_03599 [Pseudozyma flocculosa PF-1]SPO39418.1 uncharacterized protein PSFLO_04899 [Pseudozyma flocculosa]
MAPLPPYLVRIAATILTQALTRKLASSPLFFRIVDRMIHEIDHMPHRIQGRQVPTYQPPLGMREKEWQEDVGEPHDLPNPFVTPQQQHQHANGQSGGTDPGAAPKSFDEALRLRARQSYAQAQRIAERDRRKREEQTKGYQDDKVAQELKSLQDKLRELRNESRK